MSQEIASFDDVMGRLIPIVRKGASEMANSETLGERLQRLRLAAGLTQEQLAERSQFPVGSLRNWEYDHRLPGLVPVYRLAKALGVPMEELAACAVEQQSKAKARIGRRRGGRPA
jgi:transcriptional regulator with XRE-family HTH domain